MTRNLVLCADGTCNAFGHSSSNVARLLEHVELLNAKKQLVCYDQGIGTRRSEYHTLERFKDGLGESGALELLEPPDDAWGRPRTWPSLIKSMTEGAGLETNVAQLYERLATRYSSTDQVFLFGFSRGAFTVRALAGLTWRYGLPPSNDLSDARARFAEAWPLFVNEFPDHTGIKAERALQFRERHHQRDCPIYFLGLWDTVKSYGGIRPVMLPHLRHNPSVEIVRHAMSLDECRAWFELTTWGWLDLDRGPDAAGSRLAPEDRETISNRKDILEVWFSGCHADIGGGAGCERSSEIAFRWMLGEAHHAGLSLNDKGRECLAVTREQESPITNQSRTLFWKVIDNRIPRNAIRNDGVWPLLEEAKPGASPRQPLKSVRDKTIWYHETVQDLSRFEPVPGDVQLKVSETRRSSSIGSIA